LPSSDSCPGLSFEYGLLTSRTYFVPWTPATTDWTVLRNSGSRLLVPFWLWTRTLSPDLSGKCLSAAFVARADSPTPLSSSDSVLVPTDPPMKTARITNASQPKIAFLRCCALQRPARAAMLPLVLVLMRGSLQRRQGRANAACSIPWVRVSAPFRP